MKPIFVPKSESQPCPYCNKPFFRQTNLTKHLLQAHRDGEYMASQFHADLYRRWQNRFKRRKH
jgi:hypothetical protein